MHHPLCSHLHRTQAAMVASEFNVACLTAKLEERFTELLASNLRVAQVGQQIYVNLGIEAQLE